MSGLGAGYGLEQASVPFVCYDSNSYFGGHTRSFRYISGFVFDEGGHISFTKNSHVMNVLAENVCGHFEERTLNIDNYWHGYRIPHPVQCNMRGLPAELMIRVIRDFVSVQGQEPQVGQSYAHWLYYTYGKTFAETFPMVYGRKYHTTSMDLLTTDWIGPRMYRPSLEEILRGAIEGNVKGAHYVGNFRYPSIGGFVSYLEPFAARFEVKLNHRLVGLDPKKKVLRFDNGKSVAYDQVISSIPLPDLIPLIDEAPGDVLDAAGSLAFTQAVLINLGVNRSDLSNTAITYFYDEDVIFSRVNLPHMFSEKNAPPGCGAIQAEVYFSDKYRPFRGTPHDVIEPVIKDLRRCGFIRDNDSIMLKEAAVNRYANVIFDKHRARAVATVHAFLDDIGVHYCGRYGNWDHAWTDEAFLNGEKAAQMALDALGKSPRFGT
jgi:protoporphyrinogen oxidase